MEDVVAVAHEREHEALEAAEPLAQGQQVGQGLAGVLAQGQRVDDRDGGLHREAFHDVVGGDAGHDPLDEPLQVVGDVADRLALAEAHVAGGEIDPVPAELGHAGLERDPGPQAGVLEEHRQGPAAERRVGMPAGREVLRLELQ